MISCSLSWYAHELGIMQQLEGLGVNLITCSAWRRSFITFLGYLYFDRRYIKAVCGTTKQRSDTVSSIWDKALALMRIVSSVY